LVDLIHISALFTHQEYDVAKVLSACLKDFKEGKVLSFWELLGVWTFLTRVEVLPHERV